MQRTEITRFAGNMSQIASICETTYSRGRAKGIASYHVKTGAGLEYTLLPDKCLDIFDLRYRGHNIAFLSKNGLVGPHYGYPIENEFDVYWTAGMLCTCGLLNIGTDCREAGGRYHPLHGRIGMIPAEQSSARAFWEGESYKLEANALMRESMMGRENVTLARTISSSFGSADLLLEDRLTNEEATPVDYMLLYHINFGYPFLSEDLELTFPRERSSIEARTESARSGLAEWKTIGPPIDECPEEVFFHHPEGDSKGLVTIRLENGKLGIGVALSYDGASLPVLTQWKSMRSGEYALGIEPGTGTLRGRVQEMEAAALPRLEPFASATRRIKLSFYDL